MLYGDGMADTIAPAYRFGSAVISGEAAQQLHDDLVRIAAHARRTAEYLRERRHAHKLGTAFVDMSAVTLAAEESMNSLAAQCDRLTRGGSGESGPGA